MIIRLAFLKRDENGKPAPDGFEVASEWPIDCLPRIGETVILPKKFLGIISDMMPDLALMRRYEVVTIDHHWDKLMCPNISVYISVMSCVDRAISACNKALS